MRGNRRLTSSNDRHFAGEADVREEAARQLQADLGLHRPAPGSLGRAFVLVSCGGALIAWVIGSQFHVRDAATPLLLLSLVVWQPLVEELLFRGVLQGLLLRTTAGAARLWGLSVANLVTSLVFVLVHLVNQPATWAVGVFVPSLLFGLFRDRSGSVWPPLVLHIVFNGAFFSSLIASL
jgi:membrane protease YdiL (CAAX protease family)